MIFIPVFLKAALSMQRETHFDYDLGCILEANRGLLLYTTDLWKCEHLHGRKRKEFSQLNQFATTQSSFFLAPWIWILSTHQLWPPLWLSVVHRLLYFCIVIFSAESSWLEAAPSLVEWHKCFELCSFSLVSCSIFCLMPWSHFFWVYY